MEDKGIYVVECKKNKKGNYCIEYSLLEKIECLLGMFFMIFIFSIICIYIFINFEQIVEENVGKLIFLITLLVPFAILGFYAFTCLFYKLELDKEFFIVRDKMSLKTLKIDYKELRKYVRDDDFLYGILYNWTELKIGENKYIAFPLWKEGGLHFFEELYQKLNLQETILVDRNIIEVVIGKKKVIFLLSLFIPSFISMFSLLERIEFFMIDNLQIESDFMKDSFLLVLLVSYIFIFFMIVFYIGTNGKNLENDFQKIFFKRYKIQGIKIIGSILAYIIIFTFILNFKHIVSIL